MNVKLSRGEGVHTFTVSTAYPLVRRYRLLPVSGVVTWGEDVPRRLLRAVSDAPDFSRDGTAGDGSACASMSTRADGDGRCACAPRTTRRASSLPQRSTCSSSCLACVLVGRLQAATPAPQAGGKPRAEGGRPPPPPPLPRPRAAPAAAPSVKLTAAYQQKSKARQGKARQGKAVYQQKSKIAARGATVVKSSRLATCGRSRTHAVA